MSSPGAALTPNEKSRLADLGILLGIAAAVILLHLLTNSRYGFHRDELQFLSDARHLDWGFGAYPPMTPFFEHIGLSLFGLSMVGLRIFSVLAQAAAIVLTGLMAKELGGARLAQASAALAVAFSPLPLVDGTMFQYTSFDLLWWVLAAYFVVRLLKSDDPRWCIGVGVAIGLGLQTKYTIVFYVAGIVAGIVFTSARRFLKSAWFWAGIALALAIFLPNLLWQVHHNLISYDFLRHIHARDVAMGRANGFIRDQFLFCANLVAAPIWLAGIAGYLRSRRYRMLAFMYLVAFALLFLGAVVCERWLISISLPIRRTVRAIYFAAFALNAAYVCAIALPLAANGPLRDFALSHNSDLREEIGWDDLVHTTAQIRDSLTSDQQTNFGIVVSNYGEQGAIEMLGPAYHLPPPISTTNSAWLRGYPSPQPSTLIVIGFSGVDADAIFTGCRLAAHNGNSMGIRNDESELNPDIFVCGPTRKPWPIFWQNQQNYG